MTAESPTATDRLLNVPGTLTLGDRQISVGHLSTREERALWTELCDVIAAESDPFKRIEPVLARLEREKKYLERGVLLEAAAKAAIEDAPITDSILDRARRTNPAVLCHEIFRRARKYHPELTKESLVAVITKVNVGDVWFDLEAALGARADDPKATR